MVSEVGSDPYLDMDFTNTDSEGESQAENPLHVDDSLIVKHFDHYNLAGRANCTEEDISEYKEVDIVLVDEIPKLDKNLINFTKIEMQNRQLSSNRKKRTEGSRISESKYNYLESSDKTIESCMKQNEILRSTLTQLMSEYRNAALEFFSNFKKTMSEVTVAQKKLTTQPKKPSIKAVVGNETYISKLRFLMNTQKHKNAPKQVVVENMNLSLPEVQPKANNTSDANETLPILPQVCNFAAKNKRYQCDLCDKIMSGMSALKSHYTLHTGYKKFECDICRTKFRLKAQLQVHMMYHNGVKCVKCELCKKEFTQKSYLKIHMRTHGAKRLHICDVCGKECINASNLRVHIRIHSEEKFHICYICGKGFRDKSGMNRHLHIHSERKPHRCPICERGFVRLDKMRKHLKKIHKQE